MHILNDTQYHTLHAVVDRLIPADDAPGAWEAGVDTFIFRLLKTDCIALQPLYRDGLDGLQAEAHARFSQDFIALTPAQQDTLLQAIERGEVVTQWTVTPQDALSIWINHTAEGYYADAGNGGNRDNISWEIIGF